MKLTVFLNCFVLFLLSTTTKAQTPQKTSAHSTPDGSSLTCGHSSGRILRETKEAKEEHRHFLLDIEPLSIKGKAGFSRLSCSLLLPLNFPKPKILTQIELKLGFTQETPKSERNALIQLKFMLNLFEGMTEVGKEESRGDWTWSEASAEKSGEEVVLVLKTLKKCSKEHRVRSNFSALIQGKPALAFDAYNKGLRDTSLSLNADNQSSTLGTLNVDAKDCVE